MEFDFPHLSFVHFRLLTQDEELPTGWRLASIQDVTKYKEEVRTAINIEWGICTLMDGKIKAPEYKFETEKGSFFDLGYNYKTFYS